MEGGRKIDRITTTAQEAASAATSLEARIAEEAARVGEAVKAVVEERVQALRAREQALLQDITALQQRKVDALRDQVSELEGDMPPTGPVVFNADAVITFDTPDDFLPKLAAFGEIGEASTYPSSSKATGPALVALKEGRPSFFWVNAYDRLGERRTKGGDVVECIVDDNVLANCSVEDMHDGRYKVSFEPQAAQEVSCHVKINGEPLAGFPLELLVRRSTVYKDIGQSGLKARYRKEVLAKPDADAPSAGSSAGCAEGEMDGPGHAGLDPEGKRCFVSDTGNHRIQVFDALTGAPAGSLGSEGKSMRQFLSPGSVAVVMTNGMLHTVVSDMLNHRLQIFHGDGPRPSVSAVGGFGTADGCLQFPRGVAVNEDGEVYVCDQGNHRIQVYDVATGKYLRKWGVRGAGAGQFCTPLAVAVDMDGRVLVTDKNARVQVFDRVGTFIKQWGKQGRRAPGEFSYPGGLAVDDEGSIFVCDSGNSRVQIFANDGTHIHTWGGHKKKPEPKAEGEGEAEEEAKPEVELWEGMKKPMGIAIAREGTIFVTDHALNEILVY